MNRDALDDLVALAAAGDRDAFRDIVLELHDDVRLSMAACGIDAELVDELVQATFVTAWDKLDLYQPRGAFAAWLKAIARNLLRRELQARRRLERATSLENLLDTAITRDLDDAERVEASERSVRGLRDCLDRLAPAARRLVAGRYFDGLDTAALARAVAQTEVGVRVALFRVRRTLRACLERHGVVEP